MVKLAVSSAQIKSLDTSSISLYNLNISYNISSNSIIGIYIQDTTSTTYLNSLFNFNIETIAGYSYGVLTSTDTEYNSKYNITGFFNINSKSYNLKYSNGTPYYGTFIFSSNESIYSFNIPISSDVYNLLLDYHLKIPYSYNLTLFYNNSTNNIIEIYIQETNNNTGKPNMPIYLKSNLITLLPNSNILYGNTPNFQLVFTNNLNNTENLTTSDSYTGFFYRGENSTRFNFSDSFTYSIYTIIDINYFFNFTINYEFYYFLLNHYK